MVVTGVGAGGRGGFENPKFLDTRTDASPPPSPSQQQPPAHEASETPTTRPQKHQPPHHRRRPTSANFGGASVADRGRVPALRGPRAPQPKGTGTATPAHEARKPPPRPKGRRKKTDPENFSEIFVHHGSGLASNFSTIFALRRNLQIFFSPKGPKNARSGRRTGRQPTHPHPATKAPTALRAAASHQPP